ncbi:MAG: immune inhibitor A domain-containing protein [Coriobacteriia bacterium]
MRTKHIKLVAACAAFAFVFTMAAPAIAVIPRDVPEQQPGRSHRQDKREHPLGKKQGALKARALEDKIKGGGSGKDKGGGVYEVRPGEFVELELQGTDLVWTVPGEFSDLPHNSLLEPDRTVDNTTIWVEDFSEAYYDELLYTRGVGVNSMAEYFLEQSSGRYTVDGDCTPWVPVPGDHTVYDDGTAADDTSRNVWLFLQDSLDGWYDMQLAAGMTPEEIDAYLASFDTHDRYDWDGDGVFDEPDGYIDHFQSLHSGDGEEAGGGILGDEAIWSHSWYAYYDLIGITGPSEEYPLGGVQIGDSSFWVGDYTIQPENGGVGVFVHEYTHDLGVPDLYDTYAGENSTGFWTLMSSGSWLSEVDYDLGSAPGHEGPWEKLMLGWLDYAVAPEGATTELTLGPAEFNSTKAQALLVNLPDKELWWTIAAPYAGTTFYYSGQGDNLRNSMVKSFTLGEGAMLTAQVNYSIEEDYDYAALTASRDGGASWETVPTNLSNSSVLDGGIDGFSNGWVMLEADLSAYTGDVLIAFQYITDGGVAEAGFMVDEIAITGHPIDGAEVDAGWAFDGFRTSTGIEGGSYWNYYLAEYRQYWGYDVALRNAYNFGFLKGKDAALNWAERFAYQDGLLVWYCDTSQPDNNTSVHPGSGFALPVDAHPVPLTRPGKKLWRNRIQSYDSPFGLEPTDALTLHYDSRAFLIPSLPAVPVFDDARTYYSAANPTASVVTPVTGTAIRVLGTNTSSDGGSYMGVRVTAPFIE